MISKLIVNDSSKSSYPYISELSALKDDTTIDFTDGVNLIIGNNGSGKSTIINMLRDWTFCNDNYVTNVPSSALDYPKLWDPSMTDPELLDGVLVKSDYITRSFRYMHPSELDDIGDRIYDKDFLSFKFESGHKSSGELVKLGFDFVLSNMFSDKNTSNILFNYKEEFSSRLDEVNDYWKNKFKQLVNYYTDNEVDCDSHKVTLLMDEPDRNLDIEGIQELYKILSYNHPQVQVICVLHNPLLIHKLSKLSHVSIIETSEEYLSKIDEFINSTK